MKKAKPIYVEIPIEAPMEEVWEKTQQPQLHEQWDLRFSSILYLPRQEGEKQSFTYTRSLLFGVKVNGWGISSGSIEKESGERVSSLHFGTDSKLSPIREGRGYWKYEPQEDGTLLFLTQYDYEPNWGRFGKRFDTCVFRPLIGWATALSFDVLKRWLETGELPRLQYIRFSISWMISLLFCFIWIYHGLMPKVIGMHPLEIEMTQKVLPLFSHSIELVLRIIGLLEICFGILFLLYRKKKSLFGIQLFLFPILLVSSLFAGVEAFYHPFSPITFNVALILLSVIGLLVSDDVPTAKSCKRSR